MNGMFKKNFCHFMLQTKWFLWRGHRNQKNVLLAEIVVEEENGVVVDADVVEEQENEEGLESVTNAYPPKTAQKR